MCTSNKIQLEFNNEDVAESIKIIMKEEGFSKTAYPDPFSPRALEMRKAKDKRRPDYHLLSGMPWTVGYGRTGPDVREFTTTTKDQELFWLKWRVEDELLWLQKRKVPPCPGLVSLVYNVGRGAFERSRSYKAFQEGKWDKAIEELLGFNKAGGKVRPGLVKRRAAEAELIKAWLRSRNLYGEAEA